MQMPEQPSLPAYSEMTPWFLLLGHFGKWHEGEDKLSKLYIKAMQDHRVYSLKSVIAKIPIIDQDGVKKLDIHNAPSPEASFFQLNVANRPEWAYFDFPTTAYHKVSQKEEADYFGALENTLKGLGRDGKAITYIMDEPKEADKQKLMNLTRLVRRKAPSLRIMLTDKYSEEFAPYVDIFVPVMENFAIKGHPGADVYRDGRPGREVWWYVSCMSHGCDALVDSGTPDFVIDRSSAYVRSIGWLSFNQKVDAFLYYSVNNGFQHYPKRDVWNDQWDFSGNGDGTLFYPARAGERGFNEHFPVPSARMKLWRESSYDHQYLTWLAKSGSANKSLLNDIERIAVDPLQWDRNYLSYQSLRDKIGEELDSLQPKEDRKEQIAAISRK
jgi:hypothetical protein